MTTTTDLRLFTRSWWLELATVALRRADDVRYGSRRWHGLVAVQQYCERRAYTAGRNGVRP